MCTAAQRCDSAPLTFETMLTDPMIRLMMDSDGVSLAEMSGVLHQARSQIAERRAVDINASR